WELQRVEQDRLRFKQLAEQQEELAGKEREARGLAEQQSGLATERLKQAQSSVYSSQLALVSSKMVQDPSLALKLLEDPSRCPEGRRAFTWHFFHRLCRRDRLRWAAHTGRVSFVGFAAKGKQLLTASQDGTVKRWDAASGALLGTLVTLRHPVTAGALSA